MRERRKGKRAEGEEEVSWVCEVARVEDTRLRRAALDGLEKMGSGVAEWRWRT